MNVSRCHGFTRKFFATFGFHVDLSSESIEERLGRWRPSNLHRPKWSMRCKLIRRQACLFGWPLCTDASATGCEWILPFKFVLVFCSSADGKDFSLNLHAIYVSLWSTIEKHHLPLSVKLWRPCNKYHVKHNANQDAYGEVRMHFTNEWGSILRHFSQVRLWSSFSYNHHCRELSDPICRPKRRWHLDWSNRCDRCSVSLV